MKNIYKKIKPTILSAISTKKFDNKSIENFRILTEEKFENLLKRKNFLKILGISVFTVASLGGLTGYSFNQNNPSLIQQKLGGGAGGVNLNSAIIVDKNKIDLKIQDDKKTIIGGDFILEIIDGKQEIKIIKYNGKAKNIEIGKNITIDSKNYEIVELGNKCFQNNSFLQSIILPDSLKIIRQECFIFCKNLMGVILPKGLETIESDAFCGCSNLQSITLPKSLKTLVFGCFASCEKLIDITLYGNTQNIENDCFAVFEGNRKITIKNSNLYKETQKLIDKVVSLGSQKTIKENRSENTTTIFVGKEAFFSSLSESKDEIVKRIKYNASTSLEADKEIKEKMKKNNKCFYNLFIEKTDSLSKLKKNVGEENQNKSSEEIKKQKEIFADIIASFYGKVFEDQCNEEKLKRIKRIALGEDSEYIIIDKNNKLISPNAVTNYGNQDFYRLATKIITSVINFLLDDYESQCNKEYSSRLAFLDFSYRLYNYIGNLRYAIAYVTRTKNYKKFGDSLSAPGGQTDGIRDSILVEDFTDKQTEYIKHNIKNSYYAEKNRYIDIGIKGINYRGFSLGIINSIIFSETENKYKVKHTKGEIKVDNLKNFGDNNLTANLEVNERKGLAFVTCHVPENAATLAEQEFLDVLDIASKLKKEPDNEELKKTFKENILKYTWKANKSSTFRRGQATLFIIMVRAMARSAGFDLIQTNELDESYTDTESSIGLDVAALLTPTQDIFVKRNINNLDLAKL